MSTLDTLDINRKIQQATMGTPKGVLDLTPATDTFTTYLSSIAAAH